MQPFYRFLLLTLRQKRGTLLLLLLLTLIMLGPYIYRRWWLPAPTSMSVHLLSRHVDTSELTKRTPVFSAFDPNTVDTAQLYAMGLDNRLINQWVNFRQAGGIFYDKEDVLSLYAMTKEQYLALSPYIAFSPVTTKADAPVKQKANLWKPQEIDINLADSTTWDELPGIGGVYASRIIKYRSMIGGFDSVAQLSNVYGIDSAWVASQSHYLVVGEKPTVTTEKIEEVQYKICQLNTADSAQLVQLKGIGPVYAKRIIAYRSLLGGYYHLEQLKEVYGLGDIDHSQWAPFLSIDTLAIRRLSLNKASAATLAKHPYINTSLARFIVGYRSRAVNGFTEIEELLSSFLVDEEKLTELRPYLTVD